MFRTSYSFVAQSRAAVPDQLARIWYGQYNPASCSYAPLYVAAESLPTSYTRYVSCSTFLKCVYIFSFFVYRDGRPSTREAELNMFLAAFNLRCFVLISYYSGSLFKYDNKVAFWNFLAAGNYAGNSFFNARGDCDVFFLCMMNKNVMA